MQSLGEVAYNAYSEQRGWKAFNGDPLPKYAEMKGDPKRQDLVIAWEEAGLAVARYLPAVFQDIVE